MKRVFALFALAALLSGVLLWAQRETIDWTIAAGIVGAGLGIAAVASVVGIWLRGRRRKSILNMRDSALW